MPDDFDTEFDKEFPAEPVDVAVPDLTPPKEGKKTTEFYLALIGMVSSLLTSYFGDDWGLAKNAQAFATLAVFGIPAAYAIARSIEKAFRHKAEAEVVLAKAHVQSEALQYRTARLNTRTLALQAASSGGGRASGRGTRTTTRK